MNWPGDTHQAAGRAAGFEEHDWRLHESVADSLPMWRCSKCKLYQAGNDPRESQLGVGFCAVPALCQRWTVGDASGECTSLDFLELKFALDGVPGRHPFGTGKPEGT